MASIAAAGFALKCLPSRLNPAPTNLQFTRQHFESHHFVHTLNPCHILILVAEFTQVFSLKSLFQLVHALKTSGTVKQVYLWASPATIGQDMVVPYLEHMATSVLALKDAVNMSVLTKKSGGLVSKKVNSTLNNKTSIYSFDLHVMIDIM